MFPNITLTSYLKYLEKFGRPYTIIDLSNNRTCVCAREWRYYFKEDGSLWYMIPKEAFQ